MVCPRCEFENPRGALECARCGVVFAKLTREMPFPYPRRHPEIEDEERVADGRIGRDELRVMGFGLGLAILAYAIPFTRFVFSALVTLFHELGHAVMGWLMGHPSLPAFDFVYGGGFTHMGQFRIVIATATAIGFAYLLWLFRENRRSMTIVGVVLAVWLLFVTREWRRELAISSAGHLAEFVMAAIFFYKALAGVGWKNPGLERPLGAFVAFFVQIHSTAFAWRLITDPVFMDWYREGKGGALMNDLEIIALDLQIYLNLNPGIIGVARMLLLFSVMPTAVALVWYFERSRWHRVLRALRTAET